MMAASHPASNPTRARIAAIQRVVVKIGTNVLMRDDGTAALGLIYGLVESIVNLRRQGRDVLLVSSGAIGLGKQLLQIDGSNGLDLPLKQACAAVGQISLMSLYVDAFRHLGMHAAQVLLTEDDFLDRGRYENLQATLSTLLRLGVVPIINENDTVSTLEIDRPAGPEGHVFGDNDKLSALVAKEMKAELLILLSDVDGLYTHHPNHPEARFIPTVESVNDEVLSYAKHTEGRGRGGMLSKIRAAQMAAETGRTVVIGNGRVAAILDQICAGHEVGTVFLPRAAQ
jgi:glutamate 5-kinase